MNNLMVRYQTPLVGLAILVLLLVAVIAVSIGNVRSQAEERLERVIDVIATEKKFPTQKKARSFTFFYKIPKDLHIDVADQSTSDWERIHSHNQNWTRLEVPPKGTSSPWLDASFVSEDSERYGLATTPHEANTIHFLGPSERREGLPDFRLWFAQDLPKGLYILGHIKNAGPGPDTVFRLELTVHYHPPERPVSETQFVIRRDKEKTGRLLISPEKKTIG